MGVFSLFFCVEKERESDRERIVREIYIERELDINNFL